MSCFLYPDMLVTLQRTNSQISDEIDFQSLCITFYVFIDQKERLEPDIDTIVLYYVSEMTALNSVELDKQATQKY